MLLSNTDGDENIGQGDSKSRFFAKPMSKQIHKINRMGAHCYAILKVSTGNETIAPVVLSRELV